MRLRFTKTGFTPPITALFLPHLLPRRHQAPMLNVAVWLAATAAASLLATSQLGRPTAAVPGRAGASRMGVTDRMATNGILYDAWGAEGMRVLNKTAAFQKASGALEVSHYDAVLMVAARAKQNAYEHAEVSAAPPLRFALTVLVDARTRHACRPTACASRVSYRRRARATLAAPLAATWARACARRSRPSRR